MIKDLSTNSNIIVSKIFAKKLNHEYSEMKLSNKNNTENLQVRTDKLYEKTQEIFDNLLREVSPRTESINSNVSTSVGSAN